MSDTDSLDRRYLARIESALHTAQEWDADPLLLAECRTLIPLTLLTSTTNNKYARDEDVLYAIPGRHPNLLFLKRLTVFFQTSIMTWVNQPPCVVCGSNDQMELQHVRGPQTLEEREGKASRVEVYTCLKCPPNTTTPFPRYNSVSKLLQTRQGRCGEYANLFGLFCRAVGFETRMVLDFTDHVWVEVYIPTTTTTTNHHDPWVMADACEGIIQEPSLYEDGWGKDLSGMVAASVDGHVMDVTPRYTRQWNTEAFRARRARTVVTSEAVAHSSLLRVNQMRLQRQQPRAVQEWKRRQEVEERLLNTYKTVTSWDTTTNERGREGRISGSMQWKLARNEAGVNRSNNNINKNNSTTNDSKASGVVYATLQVDSYYPRHVVVHGGDGDDDEEEVCICVSSNSIVVSGAEISVVEHGSSLIAVVVVDNGDYLGCILQSRGFECWKDVAAFVETLPDERIVALKGIWNNEQQDNTVSSLSRLGGFVPPTDDGVGVFYIGQVEASPDWCVCSTASGVASPLVVRLSSRSPSSRKPLKLRVERDTVPRRVATRLPEGIMPLATQLLATEEQKRRAFARFVKDASEKRYLGYATKSGAPVYLLDQHSIPFERSDGGWTTFQFLPEELVPTTVDGGVDERGDVTTSADASDEELPFVVPINADFFSELLGPYLLTESQTLSDTTEALSNVRLVAFYFSAHWCGPCRSFTPMLAEMYEVLKEEFPTHGLEIIFVSSDRDPGSFNQYYGSMPWLAVPFEMGSATTIPQLKAKYGVRGIPSLVVIDTVSGHVVVPTSQSRQEVAQACQGGEDRIEELLKNWLARVPLETTQLIEMLALSCEEDETSSDEPENSYLVRASSSSAPPVLDTAERIKELFSTLVVNGDDPNTAAAKAIQMVAKEKENGTIGKTYDPGSLNGRSLEPNSEVSGSTLDTAIANVSLWNSPDGKAAIQAVVLTAKKYVENVRKDPFNPKFRSFKLSNKIVDRITRVAGGIDLLVSLGFYVYPSDPDIMACIPVATDLEGLNARMETILESAVSE